ncbi:hypothetical protein NDU88_004155 [Pleurodeles waltl]|uniref:Uncharacterized protein n=1 Tax=Pleurodeles waltl TaxID=8319 RepID=A0AAV7WTB0_PLEWA|nr:hypothetical protein NDU88_004155 [Pleurodeles waltl]
MHTPALGQPKMVSKGVEVSAGDRQKEIEVKLRKGSGSDRVDMRDSNFVDGDGPAEGVARYRQATAIDKARREVNRELRTFCNEKRIGNPSHDASEWRLLRGVRGKEDGLPCCLDNRDAGTSRGNPDIRVPTNPEKEDGLQEGSTRRTKKTPKRGDERRTENARGTGDEQRRQQDREPHGSHETNRAVGNRRKQRDTSRPPRPRRDVASKGHPAHDASEWRLPHGVRGKEDALPCCLDNRDAGTSCENPDTRVPTNPEK